MATTRLEFLRGLNTLLMGAILRPFVKPDVPRSRPAVPAVVPFSANSRLTVPKTGRYLLTGTVTYPAKAPPDIKTLVLYFRGDQVACRADAGPVAAQCVTTILDVENEADLNTVELRAYTTSGAPIPLAGPPALTMLAF